MSNSALRFKNQYNRSKDKLIQHYSGTTWITIAHHVDFSAELSSERQHIDEMSNTEIKEFILANK